MRANDPAAARRLPGPAAIPLRFRPLLRSDFPLLSEWFAKDHVRPFWREPTDLASIEERYGPSIAGEDPTEVFVVEADGEPIGLIQRYLIDDNPDWKRALAAAEIPVASAGIDYLIGTEDFAGRGVGPHIIDHFADDIWKRYPDASAITVAIRQENRRSWRAIEKSGFERI
jgi:aminoglycoside 6'-N-acetyltransferase